jgi:uncharacterized protein (DUF488 family)
MLSSGLQLFSIGHSNHSAEVFIQLLQQHHIQLLADVRTFPFSKYNKQFNRENLAPLLEKNGIQYTWMGETLGGRREDLQSGMGYRQEALFQHDPLFQQGIETLIAVATQQTTAMMCSEEDPRHCHRHRIISMSLLGRKTPAAQQLQDLQILHIRSNGKLENAANIPVSYQPPLF